VAKEPKSDACVEFFTRRRDTLPEVITPSELQTCHVATVVGDRPARAKVVGLW
jgi:hypothetical protein